MNISIYGIKNMVVGFLSLLMMFFFNVNNVFAGEIFDATVTGVSISSGKVGIKIGEKTIKNTQPTCADGNYAWAFSTDDKEASMYLALFLSAKSTGQKVRILGSSTCTVSHNKENIIYAILVDGQI